MLLAMMLLLVGSSVVSGQTPPAITLLGRPYQLGSYNQKEHPMWEFITTGESIDNWKSLVTIIDRPDAHTRPELDRLAEGVMQNYRSHGAKILLAKTMVDRAGTPYNYLSAAFDEPAKNRYEFDFVKIALTPKNAYVAIYGVRISDPANYLAKAKAFLDRHSGESGAAISDIVLPDIGKLPRKEF